MSKESNIVRPGTTVGGGLTPTAAGMYYGNVKGPAGMGYLSDLTAFEPGSIIGGSVNGTSYGDMGPLSSYTSPRSSSMFGQDSIIGKGIGMLTNPLWGDNTADSFLNGRNLSDLPNEDLNKYLGLRQLDSLNQGPSLMNVGMGLMNAYNIYNQIAMQKDMLKLAKAAEGRSQEQWDITKQQVQHIADVKNALTTGYQRGNYHVPRDNTQVAPTQNA
jgi:hypothetical protein